MRINLFGTARGNGAHHTCLKQPIPLLRCHWCLRSIGGFGFAYAGRIKKSGEQGFVVVAGEKPGQFAFEPVAEAVGEFWRIGLGLQAMENEGTEQDLASGVPGTVLFAESGLECLLLDLNLFQSLFDRPSHHRHPTLSVVSHPTTALLRSNRPCRSTVSA